MADCPGCGVDLPARRSYCTNRCQQAWRRQQLLEHWLATGQCVASSAQGHYVRDFIHAEQGGCCALCATPAEWMGRPLTLILDHIDGDSENNARTNLRLVCPNCDSQLPTYKARNRGAGRWTRRRRYANGLSY